MGAGDPREAPVATCGAGVDGGSVVERYRLALLETIAHRWREFLPDLADARPPRIRMPGPAREHGYSIIQEYTLHFDDRPAQRALVAKVRRGARWASADDPASAERAARLARAEFEALCAAYRAFDRLGGECHVVRPLAHVEALNAVLIEKARGSDLGDLVARGAPDLELHFRRCGRWLRHFHRDIHVPHEEPWDIERYDADLRERFALLRQLGVRVRELDELRDRILCRAREVRGIRVPISRLHGDFKLRHVWARREGIEVLDFGNVQEGACYRDVAAFLVEIAVLALGRIRSRREQTSFARAFLDGYLQGEGPSPVVRWYVIESLLKKWGRRLQRWSSAGIPSIVQRGLERIGMKRAVDRLWLDRWFRREIEAELARAEGGA